MNFLLDGIFFNSLIQITVTIGTFRYFTAYVRLQIGEALLVFTTSIHPDLSSFSS